MSKDPISSENVSTMLLFIISITSLASSAVASCLKLNFARAWVNRIMDSNRKKKQKFSIMHKLVNRWYTVSRTLHQHTDELFQKSRITKVENIFELQSLILTFNYQQRKLPDRILELFDKSLQNYNIQTRYLTNCSLKPNNELKSGNLMFEILSNWNNSPKSLREEQNLKAFKKILMDNQNQFKKCDIKNCNSCR